LRQGRHAPLGWDHIDAGVAHLRACGASNAAWLVRAHHAPGLPSLPAHFVTDGRKLRGRRDDGASIARHAEQITRTDRLLPAMLATHEAALGPYQPAPGKSLHGLTLRLQLSCLVDADHADSARFDSNRAPPRPPAPRWVERLAALDAYVAGLPDRGGARDAQRRAFYRACREGGPEATLVACEGPVGIGKSTAVVAYLLRRAIATKARHLIIVAPYTAILSQMAAQLRAALVLPDEREAADQVVAEHHHRADFADRSARDLATLWQGPVILTTAVQFFETLAGNTPAALRKLNALPGAVVFLDEAHAALPTPLWPQNWRWLRELAQDWSCNFVFASGSLARFWEVADIVGEARMTLPELVPRALAAPLRHAEAQRITYVSLGRCDGPGPLADAVAAEAGPRLLIMNTVQSAAVMARRMRADGHDVLHLSSALCPRDRATILAQVRRRLEGPDRPDWTLVATSLVEAGLDLSFRTAFRERFATASLIQIGGRINRHAECAGAATVHDFIVSYVGGLKEHPAAWGAAKVLGDLFGEHRFASDVDAAALVTLAMRREMREQRGAVGEALLVAERDRRYRDVASLGRVIDSDTRLVVVDPRLRDRLAAHQALPVRDLLAGSVQIWSSNITRFGLEPIPERHEVYWWPHAYDAGFLGFMAGALSLAEAPGDQAVAL
jgi:CRISPR-associated endonuclease/helicase Cas3